MRSQGLEVSKADRAALTTALSHQTGSIMQQNDSPHKTLQDIHKEDIQPHFQHLQENPNTPHHTLHTVQGQEAKSTVDKLALNLQSILLECYNTALETCTTKTPNPTGHHYLNRKQTRLRTLLTNQLKALKTLTKQSNITLPTDLETIDTTLCKKGTKPHLTLIRHWTDRQTDLTTPTTQMLLKIIHTIKAQIRKLDSQAAKEGLKIFSKRQKELISRKPKQAHKTIFNKHHIGPAHPALKDQNTHTITDHPQHMNKIVTDFYTNLQARPQSTSPHPPITIQPYPFSLPGAPDKFTLETKAPKTKPWLHKAILNPQTFQECLQTLPNGKAHCPTGVPNDVLKLAPPTLHTCIHLLFGCMWATSHTPDQWKENHTILLYKNKGHTTDLHMYRPIALIDSV